MTDTGADLAPRAPARTIRVELPVPISLNNAYANRKPFGAMGPKTFRGGRYSTREHTTWKKAAGIELAVAKVGKIEGPYRLTILVAQGLRGDVSNRVKLMEDLLVEHGVTSDDSQAQSVTAQRSIQIPKGRCLVIVEAA